MTKRNSNPEVNKKPLSSNPFEVIRSGQLLKNPNLKEKNKPENPEECGNKDPKKKDQCHPNPSKKERDMEILEE